MADQNRWEVVDVIDANAHELHPLREPCKHCGAQYGTITLTNGQDVVRCHACGRWLYNAPRVETGKAQRSVTTVHAGIKPKQRMRIFQRASGRCEICGAAGNLHLGHALSVKDGLAAGFTEADLNNDENLLATCEECNLGLGSEPIPIRLLIGIIRRRIQRLSDGSQ